MLPLFSAWRLINSLQKVQATHLQARRNPLSSLVAWFQNYAYGEAGGGGVGRLLKMEITGQPVTFES